MDLRKSPSSLPFLLPTVIVIIFIIVIIFTNIYWTLSMPDTDTKSFASTISFWFPQSLWNVITGMFTLQMRTNEVMKPSKFLLLLPTPALFYVVPTLYRPSSSSEMFSMLTCPLLLPSLIHGSHSSPPLPSLLLNDFSHPAAFSLEAAMNEKSRPQPLMSAKPAGPKPVEKPNQIYWGL